MRKVMLLAGVLFVGLFGALALPAGAETVTPYVGGSTVVPNTDPVPTVAPAAVAAAPAEVSPASTTQGALPVTGADVAGLVALSAILIAGGVVVLLVRRRTDRLPDAVVTAG
jgi:LPXTG-motif cell wall-anchored protein